MVVLKPKVSAAFVFRKRSVDLDWKKVPATGDWWQGQSSSDGSELGRNTGGVFRSEESNQQASFAKPTRCIQMPRLHFDAA